jgi:L,D-peptidoglycan transpeptidase YkuD (ErfK/YbiS/YcfS/YnhG family)
VGDEKIHGRFNWTEGCIAVTNEQIDELAQWVGIGTLVSVR